MLEISDAVRELIRRRVRSMDHVEVLMRLVEAEGTPVTLHDIRGRSRLGLDTAAKSLADLVEAGLVKHDPAADAYRLEAPPQDMAAVAELVVLYNQRPVTLVKLVYQTPVSPVASFADAFRIRGPKEDT